MHAIGVPEPLAIQLLPGPMEMNLELLIRGLAAGLIIAAPVGPVNLLCIRRTLEKGWKSGMISG